MLNYLRTLPLHHSQRELESGDHYTDFSFDIRPTDDLLGKLFSYRDSIEVLEPADLPDFWNTLHYIFAAENSIVELKLLSYSWIILHPQSYNKANIAGNFRKF